MIEYVIEDFLGRVAKIALPELPNGRSPLPFLVREDARSVFIVGQSVPVKSRFHPHLEDFLLEKGLELGSLPLAKKISPYAESQPWRVRFYNEDSGFKCGERTKVPSVMMDPLVDDFKPPSEAVSNLYSELRVLAAKHKVEIRFPQVELPDVPISDICLNVSDKRKENSTVSMTILKDRVQNKEHENEISKQSR